MNAFALYSLPGADEAEKEGDEIIETFREAVLAWREKHRSLGAADTASKDAFYEVLVTELQR